jgi:hypothetical protein
LIEWLTTFNPAALTDWIKLFVAGGGAIGLLGKFLSWALKRRRRPQAPPDGSVSMPPETLRLATKPEDNCWWSMGSIGDTPAMQIVGSAFATNVSSVPVRIPQVELLHGFWGDSAYSACCWCLPMTDGIEPCTDCSTSRPVRPGT